ncbi:MAG: hypothetical protein N2258_00730 [Brevinematales bacterium]|nr:hypothetical protein [Brevinematales bacterium]
MVIKKLNFSNFKECYEISENNTKLIVATDIGPRIIYFGKEKNVLFTDDKLELGRGSWKIYGGHRFWTSPETEDTYNPDNDKCKVLENKDSIIISMLDKKTQLEKKIEISVENDEFVVKHTLTNKGEMLYYAGIWALTCIVPQGKIFFPWVSEGEWRMKKIIYWEKWPGQSTNINSSNFLKGKDLFIVKINGEMAKLGTTGYGGFLGVANDNYTFIKKFNFIQGAIYPDDNCAIEIYTSQKFCELETLSPMVTLIPGNPLIHIERWKYIDRYVDPENEDEIKKLI